MAGKRVAVAAGSGFEERVWTAIKNLISESAEFRFSEDSGMKYLKSEGQLSQVRRGLIYEGGSVRGFLCEKHDFYNFMSQLLLEGQYSKTDQLVEKTRLQSILSKNMLPDMAFFDYVKRTIVIVEMKTQTSGGSVDEKLETVHFKRQQYERLAEAVNFRHVRFNWALDAKFAEPTYDDVKRYLLKMNSYYEVGTVSLDLLCLEPEPKLLPN